VDPPFHKDSPEDVVANYIPKFSGAFTYEVKDTWEDWVTKVGTDCSRCGQTCTTSGSGQNQTQTCSCNTCSWQELETFYQPWATPKITWTARYEQDPKYRERRRDWLAKGKPKVARSAGDLQSLLEFDPERPLEYFLFPGEAEYVVADSGSGGGKSMSPHIRIDKSRHNYTFYTRGSGARECDDVGFHMDGIIKTGTRKITTSPNSIEFRKGWVVANQDGAGRVTDEPGRYEFTDVSALRFEGQSVMDHYKDTKVEVWLEHVDRFWWLGDTRVSAFYRFENDQSRLKFNDDNPNDKTPGVGVYTMDAQDLMKTRWLGHTFGTTFHLKPDEKYAVCSRMLHMSNVYYKTKFMYFFDDWSEENCAMFDYSENAADHRSGGRKVRDFFSRILGFGLL
jgi:hypothetical protein